MDHHVALQYGPKYYVLVVQPPCFDRIDVKLAAVRVLLAMIRHRQKQSLVMLHLERLVLEMAAVYGFTTCSVPVRNVPTLHQKVGYCLCRILQVKLRSLFVLCRVMRGQRQGKTRRERGIARTIVMQEKTQLQLYMSQLIDGSFPSTYCTIPPSNSTTNHATYLSDEIPSPCNTKACR